MLHTFLFYDSIITLSDTNFRPRTGQSNSYRFFVTKNESANEIVLSRHIFKKIELKSAEIVSVNCIC